MSERGGSWKGTATELHEELVSDFKPDRPDELSKFLKEAAEHVPGFVYESETERFKDAEGEWKSRRILTLSEGNRRNGVTRDALLTTIFPDVDKPQRSTTVEAARSDWPECRAA